MEVRARDIQTGQLRFGTLNKDLNITVDWQTGEQNFTINNSDSTPIAIYEDETYYPIDENTIEPFLGEDKNGELIYVGDLAKNLRGYGIPFIATLEDRPYIQGGEIVLVRSAYGDNN